MGEKILKANYESGKTPLTIGTIKIPCYVLEDGTAVLSGRGMQEAIGLSKRTAGNALRLLIKKRQFSKYIPEKLIESLETPLNFIRTGRGGASGSQPITHGYEATILIDICYVLIDAKNAGVKLTTEQINLVHKAEAVVRAFSKTGIIAVIYKLTGYLDDQVRTVLNDIFNKSYLLETAKQYRVTFPLELYRQWFRLNDWEWKPENAQKRPGILGRWTNDLIYSRIAPGILKELKIRNPKNEKGYREYKHFQFLTDEVGEPTLREFFGGLIALAKANSKWRRYMEMANIAYPQYEHTMFLPLDYDENE